MGEHPLTLTEYEQRAAGTGPEANEAEQMNVGNENAMFNYKKIK